MKRINLKITLILYLLLLVFTLNAKVKEYYIECIPSDFENIYNHPREDIEIPITFTYNGKTWDKVTMRIRGDDTRMLPKKSLKVDFNGEVFENGRDKLNFNAEYEDVSYMCQYMASRTFRKAGYPCYETEHARLYVNGKFLGIYLRIENVDEQFLEGQNLDPTGNLYKAFKDGATLSIYDDIKVVWDKKTNVNSGKEDLQELIDSLFYVTDFDYFNFVHRYFDYDKMVDIIAINMLLANGSTYYHNYFMYHDIFKTKKWMMLPWDMDKTFFMYGFLRSYHISSSYFTPDNPFVERAILCEPVFNDIRSRIDDLTLDFFNNSFYNPIIDSLKNELMESVIEDTTDNIADVNAWLITIEKNKYYVSQRYNQLKSQFNNWPRSFKVEPTRGYYSDSVKFVWHPSFHPTGKKITYDFYFGPNQNLENGEQTIIKGLVDTTLTMADLPPEGKYWWKVAAYDGSDYIDGFNFPNPIIIKKPTALPCRIDADLTLTKSESPYSVSCDIVISPQANLIVEPGVEIIFKGFYKITINGSLQVNATKEEPVKLVPEQFVSKWNKLDFDKTTQVCNLKNLILENGNINSVNSVINIDSMIFKYENALYDPALMYFDKTKVTLKNSIIKGNGIREGFLVFNSKDITIENNFFNNVPDAIEYCGVDTGFISNNVIENSSDDCIDFNGCTNIIISYNILNNPVDKGISIGDWNGRISDKILIEHNLITNSETGISVKSGSFANIINNTLFKNKKSINCFEKIPGDGGGTAFIINNIMANNDTAVVLDKLSKAYISYSLADDTVITGNGNLFADPLFVNPEKMDFRLQPNSPCIDSGDPDSPLDPDGSRADIGAFSSGSAPNVSQIIINEINYNSSPDFDSGDWIELYNAGNEDINLSDWYFSDNDITHKFIIPANTVIGKDKYLVLCRHLDQFSALYPSVKNVIGEFNFGLSGNGELLRLFDKNNMLVDSVSYGISDPWPTEPDGTGPTLELISPELDNTIAQNWTAYQNHGSPGSKNGTDTSVRDNEIVSNLQCKPNPFSDLAKISFNLKNDCSGNIIVYDIMGKEVVKLFTGEITKGIHEFTLNGKNLSEGIYYCRIILNNQTRILVISNMK